MFGKVAGIEEGVPVLSEQIVMEVVAGADGGLLEGAVHAFGLAVGPKDGLVRRWSVQASYEGVSTKDFGRNNLPRFLVPCTLSATPTKQTGTF